MAEIQTYPAITSLTDDDVVVVMDAPGSGSRAIKLLSGADLRALVGGVALTKVGGGKDTVVTANTGTSYGINLANGNAFDLTVTGNVTFTLAGATAGVLCTAVVCLRRDATGTRTIAWPASLKWLGATPTWGIVASKVAGVATLITFDGGTSWFGTSTGEEQA